MNASALEAGAGLGIDNSQAVGALSSAGLSEADIAAGKYDKAAVWQWLVDWTKPELRVLMFRGYLGEVKRGAQVFEVELRGLSEDLNVSVGKSYLYECPQRLGDSACGFDVAAYGYSTELEVLAVLSARQITVTNPVDQVEGWFEHGRLVWLSGENAGAIASVKFDQRQSTGRRVETWTDIPRPVQPGDALRLEAGCDKRPGTCRVKFNNFLNFRGFPHMPGEDWALSYPAAGDVHDGSSRQS